MPYTAYYPGCPDNEIPFYLPEFCEDDFESGRIRSAAFVRADYYDTLVASPVAATWKTGINSRQIIIIPVVIGTYDGGAAVEAPGYGDKATRITGFTCTANFKDPTFKTNAAFYNALLKSNNFYFAFRTETQTQISGNPVQATPKNPITDDLNATLEYEIEVKWSQPDMTVPFDTPIGVFQPPFDLHV